MDDEFFDYCDGDMTDNEVYVRRKEDEYEDEDEYNEEKEYEEEEEYNQDDDHDNDNDDYDDSESEESSEDESGENDSGNESSSGGGAAAAGGSAAATVMVTVALIVTNIVSGFKVIINDLTVYAKSLVYDISVETEYQLDAETAVDWNHFDTGLQLVISSDDEEDVKTLLDTGMEGTEVDIKAKNDSEDNNLYEVTMRFKGKVDGLTAYHPYTISVIGFDEEKEKTYYKGSFTTSKPASRINAISGYCTCNLDGKYHFKLEYEDDGNNFTDFEYILLDSDGTELFRSEIEEPDKEQEIPGVDKMKGSEKQLVITFRSSYGPDKNAEHEVTELASGTKMEVHKGIITITQNILI